MNRPQILCKNHPTNAAMSFCVKCGAPMCPACEKRMDGRPICGECVEIQKRDELVETIRKFSPTREQLDRAASQFQSAIQNKELRRVAARIVDLAVVILFSIPMSFVAWIVSGFIFTGFGALNFWLCQYVALFIVATIYEIGSIWRQKTTLGKYLFGLQVLSVDEYPLTFRGSMWRWIGFLTALIWSGVGLWSLKLALTISKLSVGIIPLQFVMMIPPVGIAAGIFFSLGLLITFVGKHKRGFHDICGRSKVFLSAGRNGE